MAPLQGFTDFVYRQCFDKIFGGIEAYYIPYISVGPGGKIRNSQLRDLLPENNGNLPVIPQILCAGAIEAKQLATVIKDFGYKQVNLNLGCPYPMAVKQGRGAGLLEKHDHLKEVLDCLFNDFELKVSVKFRSGAIDENRIFDRIGLLQAYPLEKLIFHPRTAKQLYKGSANRDLFARFVKTASFPVVYNGDITSGDDLEEIKSLAPSQQEWMIGRGILNDPFLPGKLQGKCIEEKKRKEMKWQFHEMIFESYQKAYADEGQILMKMKQFWSYFSGCFSRPAKAYKPIKKATRMSKFLEVYPEVFKTDGLF